VANISWRQNFLVAQFLLCQIYPCNFPSPML
jgi:hypothetical protein